MYIRRYTEDGFEEIEFVADLVGIERRELVVSALALAEERFDGLLDRRGAA